MEIFSAFYAIEFHLHRAASASDICKTSSISIELIIGE